jgi:hypothetical protein
MGRAITLLGWGLIALSPLPWLAIIALPFMGMALREGAIWAVGLVVVSEALFFGGLAIVGPGLYRNRKAILNRLFGKAGDDERR